MLGDRRDSKLKKVIILSSDHAGSELRQALVGLLSEGLGDFEIVDIGPPCCLKPVSYAKEGFKLAEEVIRLEDSGNRVLGIGICGSGIGISIALNRYSRIRAARVCSREDAQLAIRHNNANVIVFGGRQIDTKDALELVKIALETEFEGDRHTERVASLSERGS